jgi:hypothetical protein
MTNLQAAVIIALGVPACWLALWGVLWAVVRIPRRIAEMKANHHV